MVMNNDNRDYSKLVRKMQFKKQVREFAEAVDDVDYPILVLSRDVDDESEQPGYCMNGHGTPDELVNMLVGAIANILKKNDLSPSDIRNYKHKAEDVFDDAFREKVLDNILDQLEQHK